MSVFSTAAKDLMLAGITPAWAVLHTGDPGSNGTSNRIGDDNATTQKSCTFAGASGGERALSAPLEWEGASALSPSQAVSWASFWSDNSGPDVFLGKVELTGDSAANSAGEFSITTATKLKITDS